METKSFILLLLLNIISLLFTSHAISEVIGEGRLMVEGDHGDYGIISNENVLIKHAAFFDKDQDGIIYPSETFQGFRAIGCNLGLSTFAAVFINAGLTSKTLPPGVRWSSMLPIYVKNIHKAKHGSDTGAYDDQGRFVPSKFEEIFSKNAKTYTDALTKDELKAMLQANHQPNDQAGSIASWTEWQVLYSLCKDNQGLLHKETVRGVYDGSLFHKLANDQR